MASELYGGDGITVVSVCCPLSIPPIKKAAATVAAAMVGAVTVAVRMVVGLMVVVATVAEARGAGTEATETPLPVVPILTPDQSCNT